MSWISVVNLVLSGISTTGVVILGVLKYRQQSSTYQDELYKRRLDTIEQMLSALEGLERAVTVKGLEKAEMDELILEFEHARNRVYLYLSADVAPTLNEFITGMEDFRKAEDKDEEQEAKKNMWAAKADFMGAAKRTHAIEELEEQLLSRWTDPNLTFQEEMLERS